MMKKNEIGEYKFMKYKKIKTFESDMTNSMSHVHFYVQELGRVCTGIVQGIIFKNNLCTYIDCGQFSIRFSIRSIFCRGITKIRRGGPAGLV